MEKTSVPSPRGTSEECCPLCVVVTNFKSRGPLNWIYCNRKKSNSNLYEPTTWSLIPREWRIISNLKQIRLLGPAFCRDIKPETVAHLFDILHPPPGFALTFRCFVKIYWILLWSKSVLKSQIRSGCKFTDPCAKPWMPSLTPRPARSLARPPAQAPHLYLGHTHIFRKGCHISQLFLKGGFLAFSVVCFALQSLSKTNESCFVSFWALALQFKSLSLTLSFTSSPSKHPPPTLFWLRTLPVIKLHSQPKIFAIIISLSF